MKRFDEYADAGRFASLTPDAVQVLREMCWEAHSRNFGDPFIYERGDELLARRCGKGAPAIRKSRKKLIQVGLAQREGRPAVTGRVQRLRLFPEQSGATVGTPLEGESRPSGDVTVQPQSPSGLPVDAQRSNHSTGQQGDTSYKEDKVQHRATVERLKLAANLPGLTYGKNLEETLQRLTAQGVVAEDLERWVRRQDFQLPVQLVKRLEEYANEVEASNALPKRPTWCGGCDERTRLIDGENERGKPIAIRCPNCGNSGDAAPF